MIKEIWKPVIDFHDLYEVSSLGKVRSVKRNGKIKKTFLDKGGYVRLTLWKDAVQFNKRVHRLVAESFIPNPKSFGDVNHKDFVRNNNNVDNLEWCTDAHNVLHASIAGKYSPVKNPNMGVKLNAKDVLEIHRMNKSGKKSKEIADKFNIHQWTVRWIIRGKSWKELHPSYREAA